MKRLIKIFILFLFMFQIFAIEANFFSDKICHGTNGEYSYIIAFKGKIYKFNSDDFVLKLSEKQKENYQKVDTVYKLEKLGLSDEEILTYVFPEITEILSKLSKNFDKAEIPDEVFVRQNTCTLEFIEGKKGKIINREKFFKDCIEKIKSNEKIFKINLEDIDYKVSRSARELFVEKSCFSTNFASSSEERKNNIKVALKAFDGLIIEEGEIFSFNEITGERSESAGYKPAKIISGGTFVMGLGGGVCQVSTTLYNACLLSNLEIIESTSHSLPVSYVEPSFDAMVSFGSSDLRVRNNSGGKIIITTSSENDICKIKIYGLKNKYKVTRQSEKIKVISAEPDVVETDYKKYGDFDLEIGEEKRISYAKDGFVSRGYLNFYNEKGELVERKRFRENKYKATRGVIIKREN